MTIGAASARSRVRRAATPTELAVRLVARPTAGVRGQAGTGAGPRRHLRLLLLAALLAAPLSAQTTPAGLTDVDHPSVETMEPAVREQLTTARSRLEQSLAAGSSTNGELAVAFGELGELYMLYDITEPALACLENAARLQPEAIRWSYLAGTLYEHDMRLDRAEQSFRRVLELEPTYVPGLLRLADVLYDAGEPDEAERLYRRVADSAPETAAAWAGLGKVAASQHRWAQAAESFERALELQPEATRLHYPAAQARRELGDTDAMQAHLERMGETRVRFDDPLALAAQQKVTGVGAELLLARMATVEGDLESAAGRMRRATELDPQSAAAWGNLGAILERQGNLPEALAACQRAADLDPASVSRKFSVVLLLDRLERPAEALPVLEQIVELAPESFAAQHRRALLLQQLGRHHEAAAAFDAAIAARPEESDALRSARIQSLRQGGDRQAWLGAIDDWIAAEPGNASAHFERGTYCIDTEDTAAAIESFRAATRLDPEMLAAHQNLGILLGRQSRYEESAAALRQVVSLSPGDIGARLALATAEIFSGAYESARTELEAALTLRPGDAGIANALARLLATAPDPAVRDEATALEIASRVFDAFPTLENGETLAMALAAVGRFHEAVNVQSQAIAQLDDTASGRRAILERRLEAYRRGEPVREPWNDDG